MATAEPAVTTPKKRVRFLDVEEPNKRLRPGEGSKPLFEDPMEALELQTAAVRIDGSCTREPDASRASLASLFASGSEEAEEDYGVTTDWDVRQAAEVEYANETEHLFNDSGVPIEPFHLNTEREEGYFDPESGSYVHLRKKDDVQDAWADAVLAERVDEDWARQVMYRRDGPAPPSSEPSASAAAELNHQSMAHLMQAIVGLLQPGESVLEGLRRLGRLRLPAGDSSGERSAVSSVRRSTIAPAAKADFDRLTECSARAMEAGEFLIHSMTREEIVAAAARKVQPQLRMGEERKNGNDGALEWKKNGAARAAAECVEIDMFAAEGEEEMAVNAAGTGGAATTAATATAAAAVEKRRPVSFCAAADPNNDAGSGGDSPGSPASTATPREGGGGPSRAGSYEETAAAATAADAGMQGFVLDRFTGYLYNPELGAYYDPQSALFGDASSGRWFKFNAAAGAYVPAP